MAFAFAAAAATCLLGVTGGSIPEGIVGGGVLAIASISSSVSAGGVAGVTSIGDALAEVAWCF
jgi:hypothetical protein